MDVVRFSGYMDSDSDPVDVSRGNYPYANNILRINDTVMAQFGTTEVVHPWPSGTNKVVGAVRCPLRKSTILILYNSEGKHGIYEFEWETKSVTPIIAFYNPGETIYQGGVDTSFLGIKDQFYHSIDVAGHHLLYVDGEDSYDINIDAWKGFMWAQKKSDTRSLANVNSYTADQRRSLISAHKAQPVELPTYNYIDDGGIKMDLGLYRFAYRYVYVDGFRSALSPYSDWSFHTTNETIYGQAQRLYSGIDIEVSTGNELVESIEIFVQRIDWNGIWYLIQDPIMKFDGNVQLIADYSTHTYTWRGHKLGQAATVEELVSFHSFPKNPKTQVLTDSGHLIYANYELGEKSPEINIEVFPEYLNRTFDETDIVSEGPLSLINTGNKPRGIIHPNTYANTFYHPSDQLNEFYLPSNTSSLRVGGKVSLIIQASQLNTFDDRTLRAYLIEYTITSTDISSMTTLKQNLRDAVNEQIAATTSLANACVDVFVNGRHGIRIGTNNSSVGFSIDFYCKIYSAQATNPIQIYPQFQKGAKHRLGIVYFDEKMQHYEFVPFDADMPWYNTKVPGEKLLLNGFQSVFTFHIHHKPPSWATKYAMVWSGCSVLRSVSFVTDTDGRGSAASIPGEAKAPYREDLHRLPARSFFNMINNSPVVNYEWAEGDRIRLVADKNGQVPSEIFDVEVKGFDPSDKCFYVDKIDADLSDGCLLEVYTPTTDVSLVGNQIGPLRDIIEVAGQKYHTGDTVNQTASVPAVISIDYGNSFLRPRNLYYTKVTYSATSLIESDPKPTSYIVDAMDWTDRFLSKAYWLTIPQTSVVKVERSDYPHYFRYGSGPFRLNSNNNNMFVFTNDNEYAMRADKGAIVRMVQVGDTVKAFMEQNRASIYIKKRITYNADGSRQVILTDTFVGDVNYQEETCGCVNPESVSVFDRSVLYYDYLMNNFVIDYANGPQSVKGLSNTLRHSNIEWAICAEDMLYDNRSDNRYFVQYKDQFGIHTINILNGAVESFHSFKESSNLTSSDSNLLSFASGKLWKHGEGPLLNIHGEKVSMEIQAAFNKSALVRNIFMGLSVKSNTQVEAYLSIPTNDMYALQETDIKNWDYVEGQWYSHVPRNKHTPGSFSVDSAMIDGDNMVGHVLLAKFVYSGSTQIILSSVDCNHRELMV